ncbi:MAG TPA: amylo-alpha-1,6-glucosidase [Candidatus Polarisedimenticolia bacterium]|nr:amylo-alpha-1,6-glucosidase [Candidatus Polarisedimenticolia bacterium]
MSEGAMADEVLQISDSFYILSTSARIDDRTRVLKHGDTFAVFDRFGDVEETGTGVLGVFGMYDHDTRFLSRFRLRLAGTRPLLLSSTVKDDNALLTVDMMNSDMWLDGSVIVPRGTVHLFRARCLFNGTCYERLRVHNYGPSTVDLSLSLEFGADFADIFEVRGLRRERYGTRLPARLTQDGLEFPYEGLDGRLRRTRLVFDPLPEKLDGTRAIFDLRLGPRAESTYRIAISCLLEDTSSRPDGAIVPARPWIGTEEAFRDASDALARAKAEEPQIFTSNEQFNDWLNRSLSDLHMMRTETAYGTYPYAGVPWFSTAFGRDGLVTALQSLWANPSVARGVLQYLAATQAEGESVEQDAQPGKILHETRAGEMAATGEIPFGRYYGSADATPLFIVLAGAYYRRTGDRALIQALWPHVERALGWIDGPGDPDHDGFVEYDRRSARGLVQQGWKDSQDSVFHEDGTLAEGPIAMSEVQGLVYAAKSAASLMAAALGKEAQGIQLAREAERVRERFEEAFWCEDLSTYALALDGRKRPCRVRASNAGQCLFSGIASLERARRVAATLTHEGAFSGWGIRTVAATEPRYNPMSYHNGSIWPHDNALIAAGFARYGLKDETMKVLTGLFDASIFFDIHRLPELFCGFPRRPGEAPTPYPVSCAPQSWAAGSVLLLLQACLSLEIRGPMREVVFTKPSLPEFLREVLIKGLRVGEASLDLQIVRHQENVGINVLRREGPVSVVTVN